MGSHLLLLSRRPLPAWLPTIYHCSKGLQWSLTDWRLLVDFEGDVFGINHGWSAVQPLKEIIRSHAVTLPEGMLALS